MVKVKKDLTGMQFGRLTVIGQTEDYVSPKGQHQAQWICICSCGNPEQIIELGHSLTRIKRPVRSCGCLNVENHKKHNKFDITTYDYGVGWTTNTNHEFYFDLEDYDKIKDYTWYERVRKNGYRELRAYDKDTKKKIRMHQLLLGNDYDHEDRDTLDNRKEKLRTATCSQQNMNQKKRKINTSGVIGVSWHKGSNKWVAYININKNRVNLGSFNNKEEAIKARLKAESIYYKEFAPQRYLFEQYGIFGGGESIEV